MVMAVATLSSLQPLHPTDIALPARANVSDARSEGHGQQR
jgi:hypothetical protein